MLKNYKMILSYDGTDYHGWQIQPNGKTIQELVQNAISVLLQENIHVTGSGRTDAGVHALKQVAHFKTEKEVNLKSVNGILPKDIRVLSIEEASMNFHARYSAKRKIYHYNLYLDPIMNPFRRKYCWHLHQNPFDIYALKEGAKKFIGKHDFTTFANVGSSSKNPVKTLYRLDVIEVEGGIRLEFEGDGFLYKMVRNIVGILVEIAQGKKRSDDLDRLFEAKDRRLSSRAAPPQGLFLVDVQYLIE